MANSVLQMTSYLGLSLRQPMWTVLRLYWLSTCRLHSDSERLGSSVGCSVCMLYGQHDGKASCTVLTISVKAPPEVDVVDRIVVSVC